jgi:hypothetical protein
MNQSDEKPTRNILCKACYDAQAQIPAILENNKKLNVKKGPECASQETEEDLKIFCSQVKKLFLQQPGRSLENTHERLKELLPIPTYCTYSLYKIYLGALELAYQKEENLKKISSQ